MPRGRSKQGYGNRTDLTAKVGGEMTYGEKQKLMDGQEAVPMGTPAAPEPQAPQTPAQPMVTPVPLTAPTERPDENILTGAPTMTEPNQDLQKLKALQPLFDAEASMDDAPQVFRDFVNWLRTQ